LEKSSRTIRRYIKRKCYQRRFKSSFTCFFGIKKRNNIWRCDSNSTITDGTWVSFNPSSIVEYNITATGYSSGFPVASDFVEAAASKNSIGSGSLLNPVSNKRGFITQNYDSSQSEAYVLCVTALGTSNNVNISVYSSIQWSETR
jgi:hypothetical protein